MATVFVLVWVDDLYQFLDQVGPGCAKGENAEDQGDTPPCWWLWDGAITTKDTAAQWVMALLTIIATILLFATFRAARRTNDITREIGEAQTRAYLTVKVDALNIRTPEAGSPAEMDGSNVVITAHVRCSNTGQSPAYYPRYIYSFFVHPKGSSGKIADLFPEMSDMTASASVIGAGQDGAPGTLTRTFECDIDAYVRGDHAVFIYMQVEYRDVFGKTNPTPPIIGTVLYDSYSEGKTRIYWGGVET